MAVVYVIKSPGKPDWYRRERDMAAISGLEPGTRVIEYQVTSTRITGQRDIPVVGGVPVLRRVSPDELARLEAAAEAEAAAAEAERARPVNRLREAVARIVALLAGLIR